MAPQAKPLYYLATPYTNYPLGREAAFCEAARIAGTLLERGHAVFCPIAHSHPMALYAGIDETDHAVWLPANEPFVLRCDILLIAKMRGWEESRGIAHERARFGAMGKPELFVCPLTFSIDFPEAPDGGPDPLSRAGQLDHV